MCSYSYYEIMQRITKEQRGQMDAAAKRLAKKGK
jgi:hypothetical protein